MGEVIRVARRRAHQALHFLKGLLGFTPHGVGLVVRVFDGRVVACQVQHTHQSGTLQRGAEVVLAVDVDQVRSQFFELAHRRLGVVDEHPGASVSQHLPAHGDGSSKGQIRVPKPGFELGRHKFALDDGAVAVKPHARRVCPVAEQQANGAEKNAFARPGLACEHMEALFKGHLHLVD